MESPAGNPQLADAVDLTRMLEQVLASGSPGPAVMAGIRVTLRSMRDLMIEAMAINEQSMQPTLHAPSTQQLNQPSAPAMKLADQMSIATSANQPATDTSVEVGASAPVDGSMSEADQIAIKRGALRASIERIVERMG